MYPNTSKLKSYKMAASLLFIAIVGIGVYFSYQLVRPTLPAAQSSPTPSTTPTPEENQQLGYIKSITQTDNAYSLTIDYIEILTGDQAIQAMINSGACDVVEACDLPSDYYLSNQNPQLRTFTIKPDSKVQFSILSNNQVVSLGEFTQIFNSNNNDYRNQVPYWITLVDNQVTHIEEQYLP